MPICVCYFLKKRIKESCAYVLEFMLTIDKVQNTSPLMCTKFRSEDREFQKLFKHFILYA